MIYLSRYRVFLCNPGCSRTCYVDQPGLEHKRSGHFCFPSAEIKGTCHHTWIITRIKKITIYFLPCMWDQRATRWCHFFPSTVGSWMELPLSDLAMASLFSCWPRSQLYYSVLLSLPLWLVWQGPWGQLCSLLLLLQGCWGSISILWCAQQGPFPAELYC